MARRKQQGWCAGVLILVLSPRAVQAQEEPNGQEELNAQEGQAERQGSSGYSFVGQSQTHLLLFQNALGPGPSGAVVQTDTHVPLVEYLSLSAERLDSPFGIDTGQVELTMWAGAEFADTGNQDRVQGDIQTASVTIQSPRGSRRAWVELGRQVEAGGAARFARFDGASAGVALVPELTVSMYGGFTVLPRWNMRPGYYHLGSAADSLLTDPEAFEEPTRDEYAVVGGRVALDHEAFQASLSLHEQRESGELGRRNLGLDAGVPIADLAYLGGTLLVDVDSLNVATARLFGDVVLSEQWDMSVEYHEAEPALLLSRQSVLSVFSTSAYHEAGGSVGYRPMRRLRVTANGYMQFYDDSLPGVRLGAGAFYTTTTRPDATVLSVGYGRVDAVDVGYHSCRLAARQPLPHDLVATVQAFAYFYDEEIEEYSSSLTSSFTLGYSFLPRWELLWAAAASRTPYAALDASTQLRLTYQFVRTGGGP